LFNTDCFATAPEEFKVWPRLVLVALDAIIVGTVWIVWIFAKRTYANLCRTKNEIKANK
jgi:hypothetical protein